MLRVSEFFAIMSYIVERFEEKGRLINESEAELIRERLEILVNNIVTQMEKHDSRFQSTLVKSGSVYEGTKVCEPNEFDFMVKITPLTDKPSILRGMTATCSYLLRKISGKTSEMKRASSAHTCFPVTSKKLIMESICDVETPEGLSIYRAPQDESEGRL